LIDIFVLTFSLGRVKRKNMKKGDKGADDDAADEE